MKRENESENEYMERMFHEIKFGTITNPAMERLWEICRRLFDRVQSLERQNEPYSDEI